MGAVGSGRSGRRIEGYRVSEGESAINYERLYEYRFKSVDQDSRQAVWREIAPFIHDLLGSPNTVLDPAAGRCEFINAIPAADRWIVDAVPFAEQWADPGVRSIVSDIFDVELPAGHFGGVFVSNFLEHLPTQEAVARLLGVMRSVMQDGGRIAIMGPNFKYCQREYFDCADHVLPLTHLAVEEHLYAAGFHVRRSIPRFLPYSFRGVLPPSPKLTRAYLRLPMAWRVLGKQFLVVGERTPGAPT
jgi:hypothetical protein